MKMQICFGFFVTLVTISFSGPAPLIPVGFESLHTNTSAGDALDHASQPLLLEIKEGEGESTEELLNDGAGIDTTVIERLSGNVKGRGFQVDKITRPGEEPVNVLLMNSERGVVNAEDEGWISSADKEKMKKKIHDDTLMVVDLALKNMKTEAEYKAYAAKTKRPGLLQLLEMVTGKVQKYDLFTLNRKKKYEKSKEFETHGQTLTFSLKGEVGLHASLYVKYEVNWCLGIIPCGFSFHGVGAAAGFHMNAEAKVVGKASYTKTIEGHKFNIWEPELFNKVFWVYAIPVHIRATLPITAGTGDLEIKASGEISYTQTVSLKGDYEVLCDEGECNTIKNGFTKELSSGKKLEVKASISVEPYVQVALRVGVYFGILWAQIGVRAGIEMALTATTEDKKCSPVSINLGVEAKIYLVLAAGSSLIKESFLDKKFLVWSMKLLDKDFCFGDIAGEDAQVAQTKEIKPGALPELKTGQCAVQVTKRNGQVIATKIFDLRPNYDRWGIWRFPNGGDVENNIWGVRLSSGCRQVTVGDEDDYCGRRTYGDNIVVSKPGCDNLANCRQIDGSLNDDVQEDSCGIWVQGWFTPLVIIVPPSNAFSSAWLDEPMKFHS